MYFLKIPSKTPLSETKKCDLLKYSIKVVNIIIPYTITSSLPFSKPFIKSLCFAVLLASIFSIS